MGLLDIVPVSTVIALWIAAELIVLDDQAGVVTGDNVRKIFDYAKEKKASLTFFRSAIWK